MCCQAEHTLTFESMLSDPLIRMVNDSDGVPLDEFIAQMRAARDAIAARGRRPLSDDRERGSASRVAA